MIRTRIILAGYVALFATSGTLFAHSGGLNAHGCHAGSQPYHCHRRQPSEAQPELSDGSMRTQSLVISGEITHVRDGDTFILANLPIRLAAVDCPEINTIAGQEASSFMLQYLNAKATCELTGATTFDRSVAYCSIGGVDIGVMLFANTECQVWDGYDVWGRY